MLSRFEDDNEFGPALDLVLALVLLCMLCVAVLSQQLAQKSVAKERESVLVQKNLQEFATPEYAQKPSHAFKSTATPIDAQVCQDMDLTTCSLGIEFSLNGVDYDIFEKNSSELDPNARKIIGKKLKSKIALMEQRGANNLVVAGFASPMPKPLPYTGWQESNEISKDGNIELSVSRATSIVHLLARYGVNYACLQPVGMGRTRSNQWQEQMLRKGMSIQEWDAVFLKRTASSQDKESFKVITQAYKKDRKVTFKATYDQEAPCSSIELVAGLRRFVAG